MVIIMRTMLLGELESGSFIESIGEEHDRDGHVTGNHARDAHATFGYYIRILQIQVVFS